jgi:hypothetical protein
MSGLVCGIGSYLMPCMARRGRRKAPRPRGQTSDAIEETRGAPQVGWLVGWLSMLPPVWQRELLRSLGSLYHGLLTTQHPSSGTLTVAPDLGSSLAPLPGYRRDGRGHGERRHGLSRFRGLVPEARR